MEGEQSYRTQVQTILEEIRSANITLGNFKKYLDKVNSTEQVILAQIENNKTEYQDMMRQYTEMLNKQSFKDGYDGGIVSKDMFDLQKQMNQKIQATYGWKSIQLELKSVLLDKMSDVLFETKVLDIERDALNRFNEMTKNEHDFFKSIMDGRFKLLEDKFYLFMNTVTDKMNEERKVMLKALMAFAPNAAMNMPTPLSRQDMPKAVETPVKFKEKNYKSKVDIQEDNWSEGKSEKEKSEKEKSDDRFDNL